MIFAGGSVLSVKGSTQNEYVCLESRSFVFGGTDTVSCFLIADPWSPLRRRALGGGLGMDVQVFDEEPERENQKGGCLHTPAPSMPRGFSTTRRVVAIGRVLRTVPGVWAHGDYAERTDPRHHHHLRRSERCDPGFVRTGTAEIVRQVDRIPGVVASVLSARTNRRRRCGRAVREACAGTDYLDPEFEDRLKRRFGTEPSPPMCLR